MHSFIIYLLLNPTSICPAKITDPGFRLCSNASGISPWEWSIPQPFFSNPFLCVFVARLAGPVFICWTLSQRCNLPHPRQWPGLVSFRSPQSFISFPFPVPPCCSGRSRSHPWLATTTFSAIFSLSYHSFSY